MKNQEHTSGPMQPAEIAHHEAICRVMLNQAKRDGRGKNTPNPPQHQSHQPGKEYRMDPLPVSIHPHYKPSGKLNDKVVLITGGDSGIGRAVAYHAAAEGAKVAFTFLDEDTDANETLRELQCYGVECMAFRGDLGYPEALMKRNIRVNAVAPGPVWTPLIPASFSKEQVAEFGGKSPMEKPAQPADIAPSYIFLATTDSAFMSGQVLHPNGGEVKAAPSGSTSVYTPCKRLVLDYHATFLPQSQEQGISMPANLISPEWRNTLPSTIPHALQLWLTEPAILTMHLRRCGGWRLAVVQHWQVQANGDWQRQIVHQVNDQPVVFAQVHVPEATYHKYTAELGNLQQQPLGETLLYHNPAVKRGPFEFAALQAGDALYEQACAQGLPRVATLWARRSVFDWQGAPLTVTEVFSPEIPAFQPVPRWQRMWAWSKRRSVDYAQLVRLHRPIPILLMLWPTLWALWIASKGLPSVKLLVIFALGVLVMRSAGDIFNDLADRQFDRQVERTRLRPLATGRVTVRRALVLAAVLCVIALGLVSLLNPLCWLLAVVGFGLAVLYPWMKRITSLPQVVLGVAYNWGIVMAFAAVQNHVPWQAWYLLSVAVLWTVSYDTMYALADVKDDERIGLRSTARLFGRHAHVMIGGLQALTVLGLLGFGILEGYSLVFDVAVVLTIPLFVYQQTLLPGHSIARCIRAFNHNQWVGLLILIGLILSNF